MLSKQNEYHCLHQNNTHITSKTNNTNRPIYEKKTKAIQSDGQI